MTRKLTPPFFRGRRATQTLAISFRLLALGRFPSFALRLEGSGHGEEGLASALLVLVANGIQVGPCVNRHGLRYAIPNELIRKVAAVRDEGVSVAKPGASPSAADGRSGRTASVSQQAERCHSWGRGRPARYPIELVKAVSYYPPRLGVSEPTGTRKAYV
jgi:hypothetical protein